MAMTLEFVGQVFAGGRPARKLAPRLSHAHETPGGIPKKVGERKLLTAGSWSARAGLCPRPPAQKRLAACHCGVVVLHAMHDEPRIVEDVASKGDD